MKAFLAASCLLFSWRLIVHLVSATPTPPATPLKIPIQDLLAGNLSSYSNNPWFGKFEDWAARHPSFDFLHSTSESNITKNHPTLTGITCDDTHADCLLTSSLNVSEVSAHALGLLDYQSRSKLVKRGNANQYVVATHWKTYFQGEEGNTGAEHYTTWNLRCGTLDYRSTGFVVSNKIIDPDGSNNIATKIYAYAYANNYQKVLLQQNYACTYFGNKCCVGYYIALANGGTKLNRWIWECLTANSASACSG